ncbi:MAG: zf-TFIIB domain-containing protein [Candidatus Poribacteria bacterium]
MPPSEGPRSCPVCKGVRLGRVTTSAHLKLDYCGTCGGVWFDRGEAAALQSSSPSGYKWPLAAPAAYSVRCHGCGQAMDRDAGTCGSCGRANVLDCPVCHEHMALTTHDGLILDVCRGCRGVWFDAKELSRIWAAAPSARQGDAARARNHDWNALLQGANPNAAPGRADDGLAHAAGAVARENSQDTGVTEFVVDMVAETVFELALETVAEILSSLFD